jgi:hypothetical protein
MPRRVRMFNHDEYLIRDYLYRREMEDTLFKWLKWRLGTVLSSYPDDVIELVKNLEDKSKSREKELLKTLKDIVSREIIEKIKNYPSNLKLKFAYNLGDENYIEKLTNILTTISNSKNKDVAKKF